MANDMFNLGQAIAEWRGQMLAAGIKTPVPLDELESHLRDDIEQQIRSGLTPQQSFEIAIQRIAEAYALKTEFARARTPSQALQKMMRFACGLLAGLILLLSGFTFFEMQLNPAEQILAYTGVAFTFLAAYGWRYAVPFLPVIRNQKGLRLDRPASSRGFCVLPSFATSSCPISNTITITKSPRWDFGRFFQSQFSSLLAWVS